MRRYDTEKYELAATLGSWEVEFRNDIPLLRALRQVIADHMRGLA